ncbi:MAG: TlpA family protein disulfide reductase [Comamonadaceae bacterium]|nr:MAG: TlpA family protein disulfide reductase [Comamonadaceae bacterium]
MNRRNLIYGGVAAAAGLGGVGLALRHSPEVAPAGEVASASPILPAVNSFWALTMDSPDGQPVAMKSFSGKPLMVNFWATWCPPCVEELPLLDAFYQSNKARNWQVIGLAVDQPSAVRTWLQRSPLSFPVAMAGLSGTELSKTLGNVSGALPFTVVFGASGDVLHRKIGKVLPEDLLQWAALK